MQIAEWMARNVVTLRPRDTLDRARALMSERRINQIPVTLDGRLVGIVTDRDLRDAFPSPLEEDVEHLDARRVAIETGMTTNVITMAPTDSVEEAARLMRRERIGAVPIVEQGHLVGVLARSDVLDAFGALCEARGAMTVRLPSAPAATPPPAVAAARTTPRTKTAARKKKPAPRSRPRR